jgi:TolB-like protein
LTVAINPQASGVPGPRISVASFRNLSGNRELDNFAAGLTDETLIQLSEFGVSVILLQTDGVTSTDVVSVGVPQTGYVLTGSVRQEGDLLRISPRLIDGASGTQIWTGSFDEASRSADRLSMQERVGTRIAAIVTNPFGPMYENEIARLSSVSVEQLDSYGCILQFRAYAKSLDPIAHERSRRCFLRVIDEGPQPSQIWAGLALVYQHEFWYDYNSQGTGDSLQRAREAARTALDIDGQNLLANLAMAGVRYSTGDLDGFAAMADRALARSQNPGALAQLGFLMTLAGSPERGLALLDEANAAVPNIPSWYQVAYSFNALLRGDDEQALDRALQADSPQWFAAPMAAAAAAGLAGRGDIATRSIDRLLLTEPDFARQGLTRLDRWIRDPRLRARIVEGLKAAGLDLCRECAP